MLIARRREQSAKRPDEPACRYARLKRLKVFYFAFLAALREKLTTPSGMALPKVLHCFLKVNEGNLEDGKIRSYE